MPSWNCLPSEMREEIVKRLDFRTRFRFRHVSKSNQELVDAVPLFIPRVVLSVKNGNAAKVSFYLGIDKQIDVIYAKKDGEKEKECTVDVMAFSYDNVMMLGTTRHVDAEHAPMLAMSTFKHVAMNKETICGGVELLNTHIIPFPSFHAANDYLNGRRIRTKMVSMDFVCLFLLAHVSPVDLEEIQMLDEQSSAADLYTYTKRMKVDIESDELAKWKRREIVFAVQTYIPTNRDLVQSVVQSKHMPMFRQNATVIKYKPNDFSLEKRVKEGQFYLRANPCGAVFRDSVVAMENAATDSDCEMRWACPKHADPFEHWYQMKKARGHKCSPFDRPLMPAVDNRSKGYKEIISPTINGECLVMAAWKSWVANYRKDLEKEKRGNGEEEREEAEEEEEEEVDDQEVEGMVTEQHEKHDKKWHILMVFAFFSVVTGIIAQWIVFV